MCMRFGNSGYYFRMMRSSFGGYGGRRTRAEAGNPLGQRVLGTSGISYAILHGIGRSLGLIEIKLAHESSYEGTPSAMRLPIDVKPRPPIGVGEGDGWHGMGQFRERWIKGYFVTTKMVLVIHRTGLHYGELSRS